MPALHRLVQLLVGVIIRGASVLGGSNYEVVRNGVSFKSLGGTGGRLISVHSIAIGARMQSVCNLRAFGATLGSNQMRPDFWREFYCK